MNRSRGFRRTGYGQRILIDQASILGTNIAPINTNRIIDENASNTPIDISITKLRSLIKNNVNGELLVFYLNEFRDLDQLRIMNMPILSKVILYLYNAEKKYIKDIKDHKISANKKIKTYIERHPGNIISVYIQEPELYKEIFSNILKSMNCNSKDMKNIVDSLMDTQYQVRKTYAPKSKDELSVIRKKLFSTIYRYTVCVIDFRTQNISKKFPMVSDVDSVRPLVEDILTTNDSSDESSESTHSTTTSSSESSDFASDEEWDDEFTN